MYSCEIRKATLLWAFFKISQRYFEIKLITLANGYNVK